jgi:ribonuclease I
MASKLVIPILFGVICMLAVVTAWENGNFKDSQVISMPTATAEKNISILVMQWGYSYCCPKKQQSCCLSPYLAPDFLIHAIWTINSKREFQTKCNGPLFNEKELSAEVIAYSNLYWPSLNCSYTNVQYWKLMWNVYGRCSGLSQSAWFTLAIKLFQPEFTVALLEKGIVPGGKYTQDDFQKALSLAVGHKVRVRCNSNSATGELQLYEVLICYSPDENEVIDCGDDNLPSPGEYECTGKIALPRKPCKPTAFGLCESDA